MPEPGSEADEAVRDARQAVYRVDQGRQLACQQVTPMSDDLNLEAALDAYEAAIRASERGKVEALVEALMEVAEARHVAMHLGTTAECGDQLCAALDAVRAGRV